MARLLQIEEQFLTQVQGFNFGRLQTLQAAERDARKAQFDKSMAFGAEASKALAWYKSTEGKEAMDASGVEWPTVKDFVQKVFGYKTTSRLYKVVKAADSAAESPEMLTAFKRECSRLEREGEKVNRSIEGFNAYVAAGGQLPQTQTESESSGEEGEGEGEGAGAGEARAQQLLQFTRRKTDESAGFNVRIDTEGEVRVQGHIGHAIEEARKLLAALEAQALVEAEQAEREALGAVELEEAA
jgi:hypothetical protein